MKKYKRELIIVYEENKKLATSYMNRLIIAEDEQMEVKEILDLTEKPKLNDAFASSSVLLQPDCKYIWS